MSTTPRVILAAGLEPATLGPLRSAMQPLGKFVVCAQLRDAFDQVASLRPAMIILPADRGAGLAACDRLRSDDTLGQPLVWLLSEGGLTARLAAHWLRPSRAQLYGTLPLSPEFIDREVAPLLDAIRPTASPPVSNGLYRADPMTPAGLPATVEADGEDGFSTPTPSTRLQERLEYARQKLHSAEQAHSETNTKLIRSREALATAHADLARRHEELLEVRATADRHRTRIEQLEDAIDKGARDFEALRKKGELEVERLQEALATAQTRIRQSKKQLETEQGALTAQLSRSRSELLETETTNADLRATIAELRQRESNLRQSLQVANEAHEANALRHSQDIATLESKLQEANQMVQAAAASIEEGHSETIQQLHATVATLEDQLATVRSEHATKLEHIHSSHEQEKARNASVEAELLQLRTDLKAAKEDTASTRKALAAARQTRADAHTQLEQARLRWDRDRRRLEEERDEARALVQASQAGSPDERAAILATADASERLRRERDSLEERQETLHAIIARLEQDAKAQEQERSNIARERDGLRADRDDLVGTRARLRTRLATTEQECEDLRTRLESLEPLLSGEQIDQHKLQVERNALRAERDGLKANLQTITIERDQLLHDATPLRTERDQATQALEATRAHAEHLRAELAATRELLLEYESGSPSPTNARQPARIEATASGLAEQIDSLTTRLDRAGEEQQELRRRLAAAELEANEARTQQIQDLDWFMDTLRAVRNTKRE